MGRFSNWLSSTKESLNPKGQEASKTENVSVRAKNPEKVIETELNEQGVLVPVEQKGTGPETQVNRETEQVKQDRLATPAEQEAVATAVVEELDNQDTLQKAVDEAFPNESPARKKEIINELKSDKAKEKIKKGIIQNIKGGITGLTAGAIGGFITTGALRFAVRNSIRLGLGASFGVGIAAGGLAGAIAEGFRVWRRERTKIAGEEIKQQLNNASDFTTRAAIVAKAEKKLKEGKLKAEEADSVRAAIHEARLILETQAKSGELKDKPEKDKILRILKMSQGIHHELGAWKDKEGREARRLIKDIEFAEQKNKGIKKHIAIGALRGALTGALGGAVGGAIAHYLTDYFFPGSIVAAASEVKDSTVEAGVGGSASVDIGEQIVQANLQRQAEVAVAGAKEVWEQTDKSMGGKAFTAVIERGQGATHAARNAVHDYLVNHKYNGNDLSIERLVYAEDYLRRKLENQGERIFHPGEVVKFKAEDVAEAWQKAEKLNDKQVENLSRLLKTPKHRLSERTIAAMKNLSALHNAENNFAQGVIETPGGGPEDVPGNALKEIEERVYKNVSEKAAAEVEAIRQAYEQAQEAAKQIPQQKEATNSILVASLIGGGLVLGGAGLGVGYLWGRRNREGTPVPVGTETPPSPSIEEAVREAEFGEHPIKGPVKDSELEDALLEEETNKNKNAPPIIETDFEKNEAKRKNKEKFEGDKPGDEPGPEGTRKKPLEKLIAQYPDINYILKPAFKKLTPEQQTAVVDKIDALFKLFDPADFKYIKKLVITDKEIIDYDPADGALALPIKISGATPDELERAANWRIFHLLYGGKTQEELYQRQTDTTHLFDTKRLIKRALTESRLTPKQKEKAEKKAAALIELLAPEERALIKRIDITSKKAIEYDPATGALILPEDIIVATPGQLQKAVDKRIRGLLQAAVESGTVAPEAAEEAEQRRGYVKELSPERSKDILAKTEIRGDEWNGERLTPEKLEELGLGPRYEVRVGKHKVYFSPAYQLGVSRVGVIGYTDVGGSIVARTYYKSASYGAVWRYMPEYDSKIDNKTGRHKLTWMGKGYENKNSVVVAAEMQHGLAEVSNKEIIEVPDPEFVTVGTARALNRDHTYHGEVEARGRFLAGNFYPKSGEKVSPEKVGFDEKHRQGEPDFSKRLDHWEQKALDPITNQPTVIEVDLFPSRDGEVNYMFCFDREAKRSFVGMIEPRGEEIGSTGMKPHWIDAGLLVTPAVEHISQAKGFGNFKKKGKDYNQTYVDMYTRFLVHVPLIQKYEKYRSLGFDSEILRQQIIEDEAQWVYHLYQENPSIVPVVEDKAIWQRYLELRGEGSPEERAFREKLDPIEEDIKALWDAYPEAAKHTLMVSLERMNAEQRREYGEKMTAALSMLQKPELLNNTYFSVHVNPEWAKPPTVEGNHAFIDLSNSDVEIAEYLSQFIVEKGLNKENATNVKELKVRYPVISFKDQTKNKAHPEAGISNVDKILRQLDPKLLPKLRVVEFTDDPKPDLNEGVLKLSPATLENITPDQINRLIAATNQGLKRGKVYSKDELQGLQDYRFGAHASSVKDIENHYEKVFGTRPPHLELHLPKDAGKRTEKSREWEEQLDRLEKVVMHITPEEWGGVRSIVFGGPEPQLQQKKNLANREVADIYLPLHENSDSLKGHLLRLLKQWNKRHEEDWMSRPGEMAEASLVDREEKARLVNETFERLREDRPNLPTVQLGPSARVPLRDMPLIRVDQSLENIEKAVTSFKDEDYRGINRIVIGDSYKRGDDVVVVKLGDRSEEIINQLSRFLRSKGARPQRGARIFSEGDEGLEELRKLAEERLGKSPAKRAKIERAEIMMPDRAEMEALRLESWEEKLSIVQDTFERLRDSRPNMPTVELASKLQLPLGVMEQGMADIEKALLKIKDKDYEGIKTIIIGDTFKGGLDTVTLRLGDDYQEIFGQLMNYIHDRKEERRFAGELEKLSATVKPGDYRAMRRALTESNFWRNLPAEFNGPAVERILIQGLVQFKDAPAKFQAAKEVMSELSKEMLKDKITDEEIDNALKLAQAEIETEMDLEQTLPDFHIQYTPSLKELTRTERRKALNNFLQAIYRSPDYVVETLKKQNLIIHADNRNGEVVVVDEGIEIPILLSQEKLYRHIQNIYDHVEKGETEPVKASIEEMMKTKEKGEGLSAQDKKEATKFIDEIARILPKKEKAYDKLFGAQQEAIDEVKRRLVDLLGTDDESKLKQALLDRMDELSGKEAEKFMERIAKLKKPWKTAKK
jgi:hypothetical protein